MSKALLIAEKPSLRRTIEEVYKKHRSEIPYEITFMEQRGHLLTLKTPDEIDEEQKKWTWDKLPFHPEEHGGWKYKIIEEKKTGRFLTAKERYMAIHKELSSGAYDFVINAGDPDQEGQLLVRIVLAAIRNKLPVKRYWSNFTTEEKVLDALKNLKDDDHDPMLVNLLAAAYGRQHSDYRFGMNLSRAATLKMGARVACGRVKTPIMSVVCQREKEIENFKPSTCYGVKVEYAENFNGQLFDAASIAAEKSKDEADEKEAGAGLIWFDTEKEARDLIRELTSDAKILKYEYKKTESYAPKLFKLATAQIAAGKMGYDSSQTLSIIQGLYEKGYMSYPRTDCEYMSSHENIGAMLKSASCVPELKPFIDTINPAVFAKVKSTKKWVDDKKLESSGHSALIPTTKAPDFNKLSHDEQVIYTLVCRQFVAIFLPPLVQNKTLLIADVDGHAFKSTGKTLVDAGYTKIFGTKFTDMEIPMHAVGDVLKIKSFDTVSKTTTCPKRFTNADLIAVCEAPHKYLNDTSLKVLGKNLKIGTPATRASIIEELIRRDKYLQTKKEKKVEYIIPTATGMTIYENLKDCTICKVDLTGEWELQLEKVRNGEMSLAELEGAMKKDVEKLILDIKGASMKSLSSYVSIGKCPLCGKDIISGPKGFYCSGYKEGCKVGAYKSVCDSVVTDAEFAKLLSGKHIKKTIKKGSSSWEQELSYNIKEGKIEFVQAESAVSKYKCPKCNGEMAESAVVVKCNCGFALWKKMDKFKTVLTDEHVKNFFEHGNTGVIENFISPKNNKPFPACIVLKEDKSGTEFKFPERG